MSDRISTFYLEEAKERLGSAGRAFGEKRYWTAVFYAQECTEYAAKAFLESLSVTTLQFTMWAI